MMQKMQEIITSQSESMRDTQEVAETFHQVAASAERLEEISRQLVQGIEYFKM